MNIKKKHLNLKSMISSLMILCISSSLILAIVSSLNFFRHDNSVESIEANAGGTVIGGNIDGSNTTQMWTMPFSDGNTYYCGNPLFSSARRLQQTKQRVVSPVAPDGGYSATRQETTYELSKTTVLPQSVAYAKWANASNTEMQDIIWASWQWDDADLLTGNDGDKLNVNSSGIRGRSQRFANFINKVLIDGTTFNITSTPVEDNSKDIKIMIDQNANTYTVGPYTIDFSNSSETTLDGVMTLGDLVYDEIVNNYASKFIWGAVDAEITNEDGSVINTSDIEVLDSSGNVYSGKFPKFGQEFYIRYTSSDKIIKIEPGINISYVSKISGVGNTYMPTICEFIVHKDESGKTLKKAMNAYNYSFVSDGLFKSKNYVKVETMSDVENEFLNIQSYLVSNFLNQARAGGYPVSEIECDIGERGTGHQIGIYNDATGNFYEGNVNIGMKLEHAGSVTMYRLREIDGREWWSDSIPEGFSGEILETKSSTIYYNKGLVTADDGTILYSIDGGRYCPDGVPGYPTDAPESVVHIARDWANSHLRYAIKFAADYPKITEHNEYLQSAVAISITTPVVPDSATSTVAGSVSIELPGRMINMYIGGNVWEDLGFTKESVINGRFDSNNESKYAGIQVRLHDANTNQVVATTTTNSNGQYGFKDLHPMHKYYVEFTYNGQVYQHTYYNNNLSGGYSTATETSGDRSNLNNRFETIDSTPNNYGNNKSYGMYVRIPASDGTYIAFTPTVNTDGQNAGALRFCDVLEIFRQLNVNNKNIDTTNQQSMENTYNTLNYERSYSDVEQSLKNRLQEIARNNQKTISDDELNKIWTYINDCMISAYTISYPEEDRFVLDDIDNPQEGNVLGYEFLYTPSRDQSRNVDFGINERDTADLAIQKDVYKATVRVNGKTQTYMYNNKDVAADGNWEITIRAADGLFNGNTRYTREIRKSEYLYDGTIYSASEEEITGPDARDLRVYVTYRITIRNQSQTYDTTVNEITDYFDTSEYMFDGVLNGDTYTNNSYSDFQHSQVTSYVGDRNGNYIAPLTVKTGSSLGNGVGNTNIGHGYVTEGDSYSPIYLSGIVSQSGNSRLTAGGDMAFVYITFEVKKSTDENGMDNRIQMDVNVNTGDDKGVGKQNIAEINGYSTYYRSGATVPNSDHNSGDRDVGGSVAGSVDRDSSVGNLTSQDLDSDGDLIITDNPLTNRTEDDTDKAPNIRLVFPANDDYERVARGYVYEDNRDQASNQAMVGNGRYDEGETLINGVTVQLVELVQEVDPNTGIPTGNYLGEYIWNATTWNTDTRQWVNVNSSSNSESLRYYSGQGNYEENHTVAPIISGAGATAISGYTFAEDSTGQYAFKAMPAGDFIVRFIYGDTTQTVLTTNAENAEGKEVADFLNGQTPDNEDGYISTSGLNLKSYNGQDYKSTTYQSVRDGENITAVPQNGSYNGVYGYGYDANGFNADKYNTQNYNYTESSQPSLGTAGESISNYVNTDDGTNKEINYYYNIGESQVQSGISDAKDVGNVRDATDAYGRGITGIDGEDTQTIVNGRSEVLTAGLKVASTDDLVDGAGTSVSKQIAMLKELMENTEMVAQTGVINTEVEWNTNITNGQSVSNSKDYVLEDIDLGLEERPIAQLKMNKEVSNVRITLQNGTVLFDTNRPVTNMSYADHQGHIITYNPEDPNGRAYRLISVAIANNSTNTPELITTYMDEELMYGARIEVDYTFTVTNVGEVDYLDKQFYYTGTTNDTSASNISTTTANTVVDYITNNMQFLPTNSSNTTWSIRTVNELTTNPNVENNNYQDITNFEANNSEEGPTLVGNQTELINNKYYNTLNTYNTIVTNKTMGDTALYPEEANVEADEEVTNPQSSIQTTMMLSTTLTPDSGEDTMVYNNLSEIVQVSNSQGRRLKWSVTGNQPMANQDLGSDTPVDEQDEIYTKVDLVTPKEIDADSSQEILILPPTGSDRNYTLWIIVGIVALAIIAGGVILIRRYFKKK